MLDDKLEFLSLTFSERLVFDEEGALTIPKYIKTEANSPDHLRYQAKTLIIFLKPL